MTEPELYWLAIQAQQHRCIAEIGSFHGRSTRVLGDNTPGVVYAIDNWEGSIEQKLLMENCNSLDLFCENMRDLLDGPDYKVRLLKMDSVTAAKEFYNHMRFDMIFIDGAHEYDSIKADILAWRPLLSKGGLFCGHDFGNNADAIAVQSIWGVTEAVTELIPNYRRAEGSIWCVTES